MKEEVLIQGVKSNNIKVLLGIIYGVIVLALAFYVYTCARLSGYSFGFHLIHGITDNIPVAIIAIIAIIVVIIVTFWLSGMEITVTDVRVYGNTSFKKRVDIPIDSISAVSTSALKGIAVASSSGTIAFKGFENNYEIHKKISELLYSRQKEDKNNAGSVMANNTDRSEELRKYKKLYDDGVITEEDFNKKKSQIIGM